MAWDVYQQTAASLISRNPYTALLTAAEGRKSDHTHLAEDFPLQQVQPAAQQRHGVPQDVTVEREGFRKRVLRSPSHHLMDVLMLSVKQAHG